MPSASNAPSAGRCRAREHAAVQARQRYPLGPAARQAEGRERERGPAGS